MATTATMVADIRLELDDEPVKLQLNGAIATTKGRMMMMGAG